MARFGIIWSECWRCNFAQESFCTSIWWTEFECFWIHGNCIEFEEEWLCGVKRVVGIKRVRKEWFSGWFQGWYLNKFYEAMISGVCASINNTRASLYILIFLKKKERNICPGSGEVNERFLRVKIGRFKTLSVGYINSKLTLMELTNQWEGATVTFLKRVWSDCRLGPKAGL